MQVSNIDNSKTSHQSLSSKEIGERMLAEDQQRPPWKMAKTKVTTAPTSPTVSKATKVTKGPSVFQSVKASIDEPTPVPEASRFGCRTWRAICGLSVSINPSRWVSPPPNLLHGLLCRPMEATARRPQSISAALALYPPCKQHSRHELPQRRLHALPAKAPDLRHRFVRCHMVAAVQRHQSLSPAPEV